MSKKKKVIIGVGAGTVALLAIIAGVLWTVFGGGGPVIGEDEAKRIAFEHAAVAEADAKMFNINMGYENFKKVYEIEFHADSADYDYDIDARTGNIEDFDVDGLRVSQATQETQPQVQTEAGPAQEETATNTEQSQAESAATQNVEAQISEDTAAKTILERVPGATESELWIRTDTEDGRLVYEGKVIYDNKEYEFEMDANDGEMIAWDEERAEADDVPNWPNFAESQNNQ